MKNLIRGNLYQLKKDHFFFACLVFSLVFLIFTIRTFSPEPGSVSAMGVNSLLETFLGGDFVLYAFMLLTANMVAEAYRSGAMKNIIGRGIAKRKYYLSIVLTISVIYLLVMLISGIVMGVFATMRFGMGTIHYPAYYVLSIAARILFVITHVSFAATMTILTQNVITGVILGLVIPNIPQILETALSFLKINVDLDLIKISAHMPSVYGASNDLLSLLMCFVLLGVYLLLSFVVGFLVLNHQDIK
jgi:hypothetical protein